MTHIDTREFHGFFRPMFRTAAAQAAMMVLPVGESSSDRPADEHPGAEQWLYVVDGSGIATVGGRTVDLRPGSLLVIGKGEPHQITNRGSGPMVTLNLYCPPAYTADGDVEPAVR